DGAGKKMTRAAGRTGHRLWCLSGHAIRARVLPAASQPSAMKAKCFMVVSQAFRVPDPVGLLPKKR
ncbi:MAG: hypothetical protein ACU0CY_09040, partial [Maritimibacter harenae]